ncbi:hypothetical protein [Adhaeribacter terreus]|uniref:Uncharacterized protein n=1 Tax=Adhaeribacter terreus TaxID=529703 RepID=A0ABW0E9G5_9BACT
MKNILTRFIVPLLFVATGIMAIVQERDYWEAASWFCFAVTVLIFAFGSANKPISKNTRLLAYFFGLAGIILLILRLTNVLPEPVRPLP